MKRMLRFGCIGLLPLLLAGSPTPSPTFTDVTDSSGAAGSWETCGVGAADIDGDGDLDLCATAVGGGSTRIYRNNGDGTFADVADSGVGGESQICVFGDVDNDGLPDLYVGFYWSSSRMFRATGVAVPFIDITGAAGVGVGETWTGNAFADVDNDGDLDLFVARAGGNRLFINNGSGGFADEAGPRGVAESVGCKAVAFGDVDGDGDQDFFLGLVGNAPRLFLNDGSGQFTDSAAAAGLSAATDAISAVLGDIDNDGDLDLYTAGWSGSWLFVNDGAGVFTDISNSSGVQGLAGSFGCAFGDYDNDGDLDLFAAGGEIGGGSYVNYLLRNEGGNVFTEVAAAEGVQDVVTEHRGAIFLDIDGDGDLDLYVGRKNPADGNKDKMYRNEANNGAYLKVRIVGRRSNKSGIGARIWVYDAGHLGDSAFLRGMREVSAGSGQASCPPAEQHFGLPGTATVDVLVRYLNGVIISRTGVTTGQTLTLDEPEPPAVINVTSAAADGTYVTGAVLEIAVRFSIPVFVSGAPRLRLETGLSDADADYSAGSGTDTLTFAYTVAWDHHSTDLDYASSSALQLNGGSIQDADGNDSSLTLPPTGKTGSLASNKNLLINEVPPAGGGGGSHGRCGSVGLDLMAPLALLALWRRYRRNVRRSRSRLMRS